MGALARIGTAIRKALPRVLSPPLTGGGWNGWGEWWGTIKEPFTGAWQRNIEWCADGVVSQPTVWACITLKADDTSKLPVKLMRRGDNGIPQEQQSNAFSPVLRTPNRYQSMIQFLKQWSISLDFRGNTYVLKERDARGIVVALYVLDPGRVQPLISDDGSIYYQLQPDNLTGSEEAITVPQSEIIHDRINPLFHPLVGISPIFAAGLTAAQSLEIVNNSARFFKNGAKVTGIITVPGNIPKDKADALKAQWDSGYTGTNAGKVAVLADGVKFTQLTMSSVDAQVIEQLKYDDEKICAAFHVPGYKVGVGGMPPYGNLPQLNMDYFQSCIQVRIAQIECCLGDGLSLPPQYFVWIDESELLRMDELSRWDVYAKAIGCGGMTPNEARAREWLQPVDGGNTPYLQQQNYSLAALARRDAQADPFATNTGTAPAGDSPPTEAPTAGALPAPDDDAEARAYAVDYTKNLLALIAAEAEHGTA